MHLGTIIHTFCKGKLVGKDIFGNCYYTSRTSDENGKRKRWVMYKGLAEPSKIPPEWHGWLHYTFDTPITDKKYTWQKASLPNLTGTDLAYMPPVHIKKTDDRNKETGIYEGWNPNEVKMKDEK